MLTERTDILGAAFLGLTVGCARCHDHKFDPIPQQDYYRLEAYLGATQEHDVILASDSEKTAWEEKTKEVNDELKRLKKKVNQTEGKPREELIKQIENLEAELPRAASDDPEHAERRNQSHRYPRLEEGRLGTERPTRRPARSECIGFQRNA